MNGFNENDSNTLAIKVTISYIRFNECSVSLSPTKTTLNQSRENKRPLVLVDDRASLKTF